MARHVIGVFESGDAAHEAVQRLIAKGVSPERISMAAAEAQSSEAAPADESSGETGLIGMETGAVAGGLIGLLATLGTVAAGPAGFVIAGPMLGLATGAGIGAVGGGLVGSLLGMGVPAAEAADIESRIEAGGTLIAVEANENQIEEVRALLAGAGATGTDVDSDVCTHVYPAGRETPEPLDPSDRARLI